MPAVRRGRGEVETTQAGSSRDDAYVYLLGISLAAMLLGVVFLYLDWDSFPGKPTAPSVQPAVRSAQPGGGGAPSGGPAGGAGEKQAPTPPAPPAPPK
jgi:hypothetical protein